VTRWRATPNAHPGKTLTFEISQKREERTSPEWLIFMAVVDQFFSVANSYSRTGIRTPVCKDVTKSLESREAQIEPLRPLVHPVCCLATIDSMSLYTKSRIIAKVTKQHGPRELVTHLAKYVYSNNESYVLRRDLTVPLSPRPRAKIPINVRLLESSDLSQILAESPSGLILGVLEEGLPQCYVAVTNDQEICFLQWLITPENRERIRAVRFREMHAFDDDSVMLEFSYTFRRFRGLGIMAPAVALVAEQQPRARWAVTYVDRTNIASLRGCRGAGFRPYLLTSDRWRLFQLKQSVSVPRSLESFWTAAKPGA
jgi:hypothetical protein